MTNGLLEKLKNIIEKTKIIPPRSIRTKERKLIGGKEKKINK